MLGGVTDRTPLTEFVKKFSIPAEGGCPRALAASVKIVKDLSPLVISSENMSTVAAVPVRRLVTELMKVLPELARAMHAQKDALADPRRLRGPPGRGCWT